MRALAGHINPIPEITLRRPLPGRADCRDDIIAFGAYHPHPRIALGMSWAEMRAACPAGWEPEVYIHWSPEYNPLPEGILAANCLTVGVFGDWNLGGQAIQAIADAFDVVCADRNGCEALERAGCENVLHSHLWAFRPEQHRRLPQTPRDIDILMIGNFNHALQHERSRWLARVARLSRKYRVVVTGGIYDEEYVRAMNRAKIVFNRSIRGEMNMRAYEAPACGAMLFYERENAEVRDIFTDREHCVFYGEDDLEELLDGYLAPERAAERERIAQAGWERVQQHTYAHHFAQLLDRLEPIAQEKAAGRVFSGPSRFRALPERERAMRLLTQSALTKAGTALAPLVGRAERIGDLPMAAHVSAAGDSFGSDSAGLANLLGFLYAEQARIAAPDEKETLWSRAILAFRSAIQAEPDYAMARFNLGMVFIAQNNPIPAEATLRTAEALLQAPDLEARQLRGVCFPRQYDSFLADFEALWSDCQPGSPDWRRVLRELLLSRLYQLLSAISYGRGDFRQAETEARKGRDGHFDSPQLTHTLAQALRAQGYVEDALATYRQALDQAPFELGYWQEAAQYYLDLARPCDALVLLDELFEMLHGCPFYAGHLPTFHALRQVAQQMAAQPKRPQATCLLAFPNWSDAANWQEVVRAFAETYRPSDPVVLMLRADPKEVPDAQALLRPLHLFLTQELGFAGNALPNITLINQPLVPEDEWKLFFAAQAAIAPRDLPAALRSLAGATRTPIWTLDALRESSEKEKN